VFLRLNIAGPKLQADTPDPLMARCRFLAYETPAQQLLEIVDALLAVRSDGSPTAPDEQLRQELQELLADARSVYQVGEDGRGLDRRTCVTATAAWDAARSAAQNSAALHLQTAWDAVHALEPDPIKAYSEAVKAVEAAAHAIVEPDNRRATLGTMVREIQINPSGWRLAISGGRVRTLAEMMNLLWSGQTSRHGRSGYRPETREQAEMVVHLAVTLVQWFASGKVKRRLERTQA
jgi:hypothetical protein